MSVLNHLYGSINTNIDSRFVIDYIIISNHQPDVAKRILDKYYSLSLNDIEVESLNKAELYLLGLDNNRCYSNEAYQNSLN